MITPLLLLAAIAPIDAPPIVLDGSFEDWTEVAPACADPEDAIGREIDFGTVKVAHDEDFLHVLVDLGREVNPQKLDGTMLLLLDADGNQRTGRKRHDMDGIDLAVRFTAPTQRRDPEGVALYVPTDRGEQRVSAYLAGVSFAPTYASATIEIRLERGARIEGAPPLFRGRSVRGKLVAIDRQDDLADETDIFEHRLDRRPAAPVTRSADPLAREDGTLRVMSWNTERGAILTRPEPFQRCLRATAPDVVLLQELTHDTNPAALAKLLEAAVPTGDDASWQVLIGAGGGDLRCAVASRRPLEPVEALHSLPFPDNPGRTVRIAAARVRDGDRTVLVASIHLKCCGRIGSREDRTRQTEVECIARGISAARRPDDSLVIAGDFNLVGGRGPLDHLVTTCELTVAEPLQLDGRTAATWLDPDQPFMPGRLDYLLSGGPGAIDRTFVLDTRDLSRRQLESAGLRATDGLAADHLPLVADLRRAE